MNAFRVIGLLVIVSLCRTATAASLALTVKDTKGATVSDAVVYARKNGATPQMEKFIPTPEDLKALA